MKPVAPVTKYAISALRLIGARILYQRSVQLTGAVGGCHRRTVLKEIIIG
jgi:hypothetical protein